MLDLLAPSLQLHPNGNHFPFSVKPEKPVAPEKIMELFRDTFEGTDFDVVKNLTVVDDAGQTVKSPLANPFMPYDMHKMLRINGGWGWMGERCMARWFCMYATVTQSRDWLPDPVGGVVWLGYSNPAMTIYVPIYAGVTDLPEDYKTDGRTTGFSHRSAWWAFRRVATIAAHRWGDMRNDVAAVRNAVQSDCIGEEGAPAVVGEPCGTGGGRRLPGAVSDFIGVNSRPLRCGRRLTEPLVKAGVAMGQSDGRIGAILREQPPGRRRPCARTWRWQSSGWAAQWPVPGTAGCHKPCRQDQRRLGLTRASGILKDE